MKFKKNGGFTLVELIVVIAILAILAGIAVPMYSGYIAKANKAADLQMLSAVNTAFGAAAVENGTTVADLAGTVMTIDGDGKITDMTPPARSGEESPVFTSFKKYYDIENDGFKTVKSTTLTSGLTGFSLPDEVAADSGIYGKVIQILKDNGTITEEQIETLKSGWFGNEGADEILDKVGLVTELSNLLAIGDETNNPSSAYQDFLLMGAADMDEEELAAMQQQMMEQNPDMDEEEALYSVLTNLAVLNAAKNTDTSKTTASIADEMRTGKLTGDMLKTLMKNDNVGEAQGALGEAAMIYGLYTAWANKEGTDEDKQAAESINGFLNNGMNNEKFLDYLETDAAQADLDSYNAAMQIINSSADDKEAVNNLLVNGFDDPALEAALKELLK